MENEKQPTTFDFLCPLEKPLTSKTITVSPDTQLTVKSHYDSENQFQVNLQGKPETPPDKLETWTLFAILTKETKDSSTGKFVPYKWPERLLELACDFPGQADKPIMLKGHCNYYIFYRVRIVLCKNAEALHEVSSLLSQINIETVETYNRDQDWSQRIYDEERRRDEILAEIYEEQKRKNYDPYAESSAEQRYRLGG